MWIISKKKNLYEIILVIASSLIFILNGGSAFDTSLDTYPFIERSLDSGYLPNDFFTNAISNEFNPKQFLGIFISQISIIFNVDWYYILYGFKVLYVLFAPIVFFRILNFLAEKLSSSISLEALFLGTIFGISPFSKLFSIAWWPPFDDSLIPASLSVIVIFSSFLFRNKSSLIFIIFQLAGIFLHPAMYCYTTLFVFSILVIKFNKNRKFILINGFISVILILLHLVLIKIPNFIDPNLFIKIYTLENHSSHYRVAYFGTYLPKYLDWKFFLGIMNASLLMGQLTKNNLVKKGSLIGIILLNVSVIMQWIAIDVFPNKLGAILGPIRYTQFIYWYVVFYGAIIFNNYFKLNFTKRNSLKSIPNVKYVVALIFFLLLIRVDNPKDNFLNTHNGIEEFISSTDRNSIFIIFPTSDFKFYFQYALNRSVFNGIGFPFNEKYFEEFQARKNLTYGSFEDVKLLKGSWIGEKHQNFFRNLTPNDFLLLSKNQKIDFVIIEKLYNQNFKEYVPSFSNEEVEIYRIDQFNSEI